MRAWLGALGGMAKGTVDALFHGNFMGSAALAAGTALFGGGLVVRGGLGFGKGIYKGGKWGLDKIKNRAAIEALSGSKTMVLAEKTTMAASELTAATRASAKPLSTISGIGAVASAPPVTTTASKAASAAGAVAAPTAAAAQVEEGLTGTSKALSAVSKVAKIAGKVAMPLAVATEIYDISKSDNKAVAAVKSAGGLGGGLAGAKVGAAIGTAILPGIGTAIGAGFGGLSGYLAGKSITGKVIEPKTVEAATASSEAVAGAPLAIEQAMTETVAIQASFNANLQAKAAENIANMGNWSEQTWNITAISTAFATNLQVVVDSIIANAWKLSGALTSAVTRAAALPSLSVPGAPMVAYATGGFANQPSIFGEAGLEAAIPIDGSPRSVALWEKTGQLLGVKTEIPAAATTPVAAHAAGGIMSRSHTGKNKKLELWQKVSRMTECLGNITLPKQSAPEMTGAAPLYQDLQHLAFNQRPAQGGSLSKWLDSLKEAHSAGAGSFNKEGDTIHVTFAPNISVSTPGELTAALNRQQKSFMKQLEDVLHQKRRVSFE